MISKTTQPTLNKLAVKYSQYDVKFTKCGDSKNSFSFKSYAFSNNCLLFVLMGKRIFDWQQWYWVLHHEQMISDKEIHTLITFMVSVMASNTVDGL